MSALQLDLDDEILALLREGNRPAGLAAREMITLELYRRGTISSGKAAQLLGMERVEFIRYSGRLGIPFFDMAEDEWAAERELLKAP